MIMRLLPYRWLAVLLINLSALGTELGPDSNPALGTAKVTEAEEHRLGRMCSTLWTFSQPTLCDDNVIALRVKAVLDSITAYSDRPRLSYTLTVINDPLSVNAYAAPGGFVAVTTGLLEQLGGPDELAAVLAHELAHISGRHAVRKMLDDQNAARKIYWLGILGRHLSLWAGAAAGAAAEKASPDIALLSQIVAPAIVESAIIAPLASILETSVSGYGAPRELQADRLGIEYVKRSNRFDPAAALTVMRRLELLANGKGATANNRSEARKRVPYSDAHPSLEQRIKAGKLHLQALHISCEDKDLSEVKVPSAFGESNQLLTVRSVSWPVTVDDLWASVSRLALQSPQFRDIRAADRSLGSLTLALAGDRWFPASLAIQVAATQSAGAAVTVSVDSSDHRLWPTAVVQQLRADLGLEDYRCLRDVKPAPGHGCEHCYQVKGAPEAIWDELWNYVPYARVRWNRSAGLFHYIFAQGSSECVGLKVVVVPGGAGTCQVFLAQGVMNVEGKPGVTQIIQMLKDRGHEVTKRGSRE
jgi:hypothetical protein